MLRTPGTNGTNTSRSVSTAMMTQINASAFFDVLNGEIWYQNV